MCLTIACTCSAPGLTRFDLKMVQGKKRKTTRTTVRPKRSPRLVAKRETPVAENESSGIEIELLGVQQLKRVNRICQETKKWPTKGYLIASKGERAAIYKEMEIEISRHEVVALHPHGGRPWQCKVNLSDDNKSPLFKWWEGKLELASLAVLLDKIPLIPTTHTKPPQQYNADQFAVQVEREQYARHVESVQSSRRPLCELSAAAALYPQVSISRVYKCPLGQVYKSRSKALEASTELARRDALIDKYLFGIGARGTTLVHTLKASKAQALEVGKYRFERDGLWVIAQEDQWQWARFREQQRLWEEQHQPAVISLSSSGRTTPSQDEEPVPYRRQDTLVQDLRLSQEMPAVPAPQPPSASLPRWRLTAAQVELCYEACMAFYHKAMFTIKARGLHQVIFHEDGFDVFHQRGRGRFDMQVPEITLGCQDPSSAFGFLHQAAWLPVINQILGDHATLIHQGCFLSLPSSETQVRNNRFSIYPSV